MALIICPECGKEFSDKAPACPNCGCPTSEIQKDLQPKSNSFGKKETEEYALTYDNISMSIIVAEAPSDLELHSIKKNRITQTSDGYIYFNNNVNMLYRLVGYNWPGPQFQHSTRYVTNSSSQTIKKGKAGKIGAGAILGSFIAPGIGTAVGAAMGAGSKGKSYTQGQENTNIIENTQEINQKATLRIQNIASGRIYVMDIWVNTQIDTKLQHFHIFDPITASSELPSDEVEYRDSVRKVQEQIRAIEKNGYKKYVFLAHLDKDTCPICGRLDGFCFPVKNAKIGVNCPPMHKGCRCEIVISAPNFLPESRISISPITGKEILVSGDLTYKKWIKNPEGK